MPNYTAAQLRSAWKSVMSSLGFRLESSCFVRRHGPVRHSVIFQRSTYSRDVLVNLFVSVNNPFESDKALEEMVCLHAYLHPDGARFASLLWDENELVGKARVFERFGPPFFEQFESIGNLIAVVEAAQAQFQQPETYLRGPIPEPTDSVAREFLAKLPTRRPGPVPWNEVLLALLYWHSGDTGRVTQHARRYLELNPRDDKMKARLEAMTRPVA